LERFLLTVEHEGFRPRRVLLATARYHRWIVQNATASWTARARTLNEIYETYDLNSLEASYPETRLRIFRDTVFATARPDLAQELDDVVQKARRKPVEFDELLGWITEVHGRLELTEDETYFLARMAYGHLAPAQEAGWMVLDHGSGPKLELVVAQRDIQGRETWIRPPTRPAEILELQRDFREAGLNVRFQPEHDYLLLVDGSENVIGGLYYREFSKQIVHMEKLVVGRSHRGRGLGALLLEEFCRQAASRGYMHVTTGFFRPDYFAKLGFRTEKGLPGLVRRLVKEEVRAPAQDEGGSSSR
jgi:GNAT superfamily N-acetyltransferase